MVAALRLSREGNHGSIYELQDSIAADGAVICRGAFDFRTTTRFPRSGRGRKIYVGRAGWKSDRSDKP